MEDRNGATSFLSAHSKGGILKCDQLLTEKVLKQVYKGIDLKKGVKINVTELMGDENTYQKGIIADNKPKERYRTNGILVNSQ